MQLFNKKLKFLTFTTIGLFYDIIGVAILTLFYKPVIKYNDMRVGNLSGALYNPHNLIPKWSLFFIFIGFVCLLVDNLLEIYKPKKESIKTLFKIIIIFFLLFFLEFIIEILIRTIIILF